MSINYVRRRLQNEAVSACTFAGLLLLITTGVGCADRSSQKARTNVPKAVGNMVIRTSSGVVLNSFFEGLHIDPQFANGRNPAAVFARTTHNRQSCAASGGSTLLARTSLKIQHLLGLTTVVHAQATCYGCFQEDKTISCAPYCGGDWNTTEFNRDKLVGSYSSQDTGCNPPFCVALEWFTCAGTPGC